MPARLSEVAALAGVHPATASRALNEATRNKVSADTVLKVRRAAEQLNYSPNPAARSLVTNRTSTVGVIIGDLTVPLFPPLLRGVDDVTSAAGYTALIVNTDNDWSRELARIAALQARRVDGLIVATATSGDQADPRIWSSVAPTVFVVRAPADPLAPTVLSDDSMGVHLAVEHLVAQGHRRIAHVAGPPEISTATARLRAYREALFERGIEVDPALVTTMDSISADAGTEALGRLLDSGAGVTAVLAFNDIVAYGCYRAVRQRGLRCPEDISIVGYSDMNGADLVAPPLTTVHVDHQAMGAEAARMLLGMLSDPGARPPHSVRLPVSLTVRESTAPPRQGVPR
ncbi:LacI family DNA-binding transcriptional regulator [Nakamurella leprariae]|uniref:LacI family DNA-binding transcriptional regulator n=1 Tax=Nakamurella leprariae TaxID=2803911 RepID=A0A938YGS3_9ACTN|nr:LacI family DNA-binding transcriptional regulator [Nakamurella leprariae]MBM9467834.1 LacI family DNA-binding transcriptional regulator [Nakamurella leprariae]